MEEGVLQQQRQRFEEMQAYLKAQHAQQMAALNEERGKLQTQGDAEGEFILGVSLCVSFFMYECMGLVVNGQAVLKDILLTPHSPL